MITDAGSMPLSMATAVKFATLIIEVMSVPTDFNTASKKIIPNVRLAIFLVRTSSDLRKLNNRNKNRIVR